MHREALKPCEAATLLGIGRNKLRQILASGELPAIRLGPRSLRIPLPALRAWLRAKADGSSRPRVISRGTNQPSDPL